MDNKKYFSLKNAYEQVIVESKRKKNYRFVKS